MFIALGIYVVGYFASYAVGCYAARSDPRVRLGIARLDYVGTAVKCLAWPILLCGVLFETIADRR